MKPGDLVVITGKAAYDASCTPLRDLLIGLRGVYVKDLTSGVASSGFAGFATIGSLAVVAAVRHYVDKGSGPDGEYFVYVRSDLLLVASVGAGWVIEENVSSVEPL